MEAVIAYLVSEWSVWQDLMQTMMTWTEINATILGLVYVILLMRENIWAWPAGILSSLLSISLFIEVKLYAEAILYAYYVIIGIYGWWRWAHPQQTGPFNIRSWKLQYHAIAVGVIALLALGLGFLFAEFTDAQRPFVDAQTTSFSFFASYLEAAKYLGGWVYWIIINALSIWLYTDRGLDIYTWLMVLNTILSVVGWWSWRKRLRAQDTD